MEYFFNGAGKKKKENYEWLRLATGQIDHVGQDYVYVGTSKTLDELTMAGISFIANLNDSTYILFPSLSRNLFENVDVDLQLLLSGGQEGGEFYPSNIIDPTGFMGSRLGLIKVRYSF